LLNAFINYAKGKGVKCIYANAYQTELNPNQHFWQRNGFKEYSKVRTLYWQKYYPDETIFFVCYIKETG
jgi:GNAT superfamily N-acetyltransferase